MRMIGIMGTPPPVYATKCLLVGRQTDKQAKPKK